MCVVQVTFLGGVNPEWRNSLQPLDENKYIHCVVESEGRSRQRAGLCIMNHIRKDNFRIYKGCYE